MNDYPDLNPRNSDDAAELLDTVVKERRNDVKDYYNLTNRFLLGRSVGRVPSAFNNVISGDKIGDFAIDFTSGYAYWLIDNAGTGVWARVPIDTSW